MKNKYIKIESSFFEHLLLCLANQKFIKAVNADATTCDYKKIQIKNQKIIDKAYKKGMDILLKN